MQLKTAFYLFTMTLIAGSINSCIAKYTVYNNTEFPDTQESFPGAAVVESRGLRLWIDGNEAVHSHKLILKPGSYLVRFSHIYLSRSGAAYCELLAGKIYKLEVTDRQYLPKSGVYADLGVCTEVIPEAAAPQ